MFLLEPVVTADLPVTLNLTSLAGSHFVSQPRLFFAEMLAVGRGSLKQAMEKRSMFSAGQESGNQE